MNYKIRKTKYDIAINAIGLIVLIGMFLYLIINWGNIPAKIPGHYDFTGTVGRWENKNGLWFCPIIAFILYIGITVLEGFPNIWNTGISVTDKNRDQVYQILKHMIVTLKGVIVVIFAFITINSAMAKSLQVWVLPVMLILIFGPMAVFLTKLFKVK
jgi:hypothetical protein